MLVLVSTFLLIFTYQDNIERQYCIAELKKLNKIYKIKI